MHISRERFGRFFRGDSDGLTRAQVNEGRSHLAEVAKFQGSLAKAASRNYTYGIGCAAVDFDDGNQALSIFSSRVINAKFFQPQHGHAHAEHLPGTEVPVGLFGFAKIIVQKRHSDIESVI
jgi:hypothetical protein